MQIFICLLSGKTISMDVTSNTLLIDIIQYAKEYHNYNYKNIKLIENYSANLNIEKINY